MFLNPAFPKTAASAQATGAERRANRANGRANQTEHVANRPVELDMIRLEVDRTGGSNFVRLATDTTPNYTDTQPLPASAAKWTYRAIYYVGDQAVGQWSDLVSITVGA